jgi:hypothetical protein
VLYSKDFVQPRAKYAADWARFRKKNIVDRPE